MKRICYLYFMAFVFISGCTTTRYYPLSNYRESSLGKKEGAMFKYQEELLSVIAQIASKDGQVDYSLVALDTGLMIRSKSRFNRRIKRFLKPLRVVETSSKKGKENNQEVEKKDSTKTN